MTSVLIRRGGYTQDVFTHKRKGHVRTQQEGSCLSAKENGFRKIQIYQHLDFVLSVPEL
jgi:hypothetical protein